MHRVARRLGRPVRPLYRRWAARRGEVAFLIVGAGRSGTSLLAASLDAHPELTVGFERWSIPILMGTSAPWTERGADERVDGFLDACRREAYRAGGTRWGNKITTEQLRRAAPDRRSLDGLFTGRWAGIPVVGIMRDGRSCVSSKIRRTGASVELACDEWRYALTVLDAVEQSAAPSHVLRYEDLVAHPADVLAGVCAFLGVPFDDAVLGGTQSEKMLPEYRRDGFDPVPAQGGTLALDWDVLIGPDLRARGYA